MSADVPLHRVTETGPGSRSPGGGDSGSEAEVISDGRSSCEVLSSCPAGGDLGSDTQSETASEATPDTQGGDPGSDTQSERASEVTPDSQGPGSGRHAQCGWCEAAPPSTLCSDCGSRMCPDCCTVHSGILFFREHRVQALGAEGWGGGSPAPEVPLLCGKHKGERLKLFCADCEQVICWECTMVDHPRPAHTSNLVDDVVEPQREELRGLVNGLRRTKLPALEAAIHHLTGLEAQVAELEAAAQLRLKQGTAERMQELRTKERALAAKLVVVRAAEEEALKRRRMALEAGVDLIRRECEAATHILDCGTKVQLLGSKAETKQRLCLLQEKEWEQAPTPQACGSAPQHAAAYCSMPQHWFKYYRWGF